MTSDAEQGSPAGPRCTVRQLVEDGSGYLGLELVVGVAALDEEIAVPRIQKPGLAFTGYVDFIHPGRVQVLGSSELGYLEQLERQDRRRVLRLLTDQPLTCIAITKGLEPPSELVELCDDRDIPLLRSSLMSSDFIDRLTHFLDFHLAPRTTVHGVLVDVYGIGVLLTGSSGIGKSECALDLVVRGHRLVSDDVVEIRRRQGEILVGRGPELIRHHMELRGLGIINIADMFGAASIRQRKRVELVVELEDRGETEFDRLGLDDRSYEVLGVELPLVRLPVRSGRNLSILVEVATRNLLLKLKGYHPAEGLSQRLQRAMQEPPVAVERYDIDEGEIE